MDGVEYRNAKRQDLIGVAEVFLRAFPESVEHYVGHPMPPTALADAFNICLDTEPGAFFITSVDEQVAGYVFAPSDISRVYHNAVVHGHVLRMFGHWVTGQYGVGLRPAIIAVKNWIAHWRESRSEDDGGGARILSIAVDPNCQGRGLGRRLISIALDHLRSQGIKSVRLEVRPDNLSAVHLYTSVGFETKGRTCDTQGEWLIMVKDFQGDQ